MLPVLTISAINWAHTQFEYEFILKTDDDSLVNVDEVSKNQVACDEQCVLVEAQQL